MNKGDVVVIDGQTFVVVDVVQVMRPDGSVVTTTTLAPKV